MKKKPDIGDTLDPLIQIDYDVWRKTLSPEAYDRMVDRVEKAKEKLRELGEDI